MVYESIGRVTQQFSQYLNESILEGVQEKYGRTPSYLAEESPMPLARIIIDNRTGAVSYSFLNPHLSEKELNDMKGSPSHTSPLEKGLKHQLFSSIPVAIDEDNISIGKYAAYIDVYCIPLENPSSFQEYKSRLDMFGLLSKFLTEENNNVVTLPTKEAPEIPTKHYRKVSCQN